MPRLAYRYIGKEVFPYLLIALLVLTVIVFASQASEFAELFVKKNVPPALVRTLLFSLMPRILILTLPLSLLVGIMTGLGRMSGDGETIALFAGGISRAQVLAPMLIMALGTASATFYLLAFAMPQAARRFREIRAELVLHGMRTQVKPRVFDNRFANKILYIGAINRHNDIWDGIFLALSDGQPEPIIITARRGRLELGESPGNSTLSLFDGVIHKCTSLEGKRHYDVEAFESSHVQFDAKSKEAARYEIESPTQISLRSRLQEMTIGELLEIAGNTNLRVRAWVEFHKRLAVSLSPIVFALVGVALGISKTRTGRGSGFGLSILFAAIYYFALLGGENLARSAASTYAPGFVWSGNALLLGLACIRLTSQRVPGIRIGVWPRRGVKTLLVWPETLLRSVVRWVRGTGERATRSLMLLSKHPRGRQALRFGSKLRVADCYLARTFASFFLTVLVGLWTLFTIFTAFEVWPDVVRNGIPARDLAQYLFYLSPGVISYLAPPTALIAALVTMSVMSKTSEITALQAAGISVYRAAVPLMAAGLALSAAMVAWQQFVVPDANASQDQLRFYIKRGHLPSEVEISPELLQTNWVFSSAATHRRSNQARDPQISTQISGERIFHFRSFDRRASRLDHPLVLELGDSGFTIRLRLDAEEAQWVESQHVWLFSRGVIWEFIGSKLTSQQQFDRLVLALDEEPEYFARKPKKPDYMTYTELAAYTRDLEASGVNTIDLKIALERKKANAVACFVMTLFGIPFGLTFGRRGALQAAGIGISIGLLYWLLLGFFEQLGKYEYFSPALAAWSPNGLLAAVGTYLLFRVRS